jgi:penicillin amidase
MALKQQIVNPVLGTILKALLFPIGKMRLPQVDGVFILTGVVDSAEILRDRWGIPHIFAKNENDLFFAQGFVHAQERLWQMDFTRRVVFGRLSEVLGEAALPVDRVMRTLGLFRSTEQEAELLSREFRSLLESYCAGVNTWIEVAKNRKKLPLEFMLLGYHPEPWKASDSLGWGKLMCWTLAANWQSELYRGMLHQHLGKAKTNEMEINIDKARAVVLDPGSIHTEGKTIDVSRAFSGPTIGSGVGSNNWVVDGNRSATGTPLLANDMHLELTAPGVWYENHLAGGRFDIAGVVMPGVPLVIAGHNRKVAWAYTDSFADTQDLYEEHIRQSDDGRSEYEFKGNWVPLDSHREIIKIKGGKTVEEEVSSTRWTALEPSHTFQAIYEMSLAGDCYSFREALRSFDNPSQNIVYADTKGNIAYTLNGRIPIRPKGDGSIPAPGWTGDYEWTGFIPFEELPHLFNPPCGFIASANNQVQKPDFPYFIGKDYVVSDRAGRIVELLKTNEKVDLAYFKRMQFDLISLSARIFSSHVKTLNVTDPELKPIIEGMATWDGKLDQNSSMACVFEVTIRFAIRMLLDHHLGDFGLRVRGEGPFPGEWPGHIWEWFVNLLDEPDSPSFDMGHGEKRDDILNLALREAVHFLKVEFGSELKNWQWKKLHFLIFNHILGAQKPLDRIFNLGPFPLGGDASTIWATYMDFHGLEVKPVVGPPFRFIADLGDLDHCEGILAPGQSGHATSPHYSDGIKPWFEGSYHPILIQRKEIEENLEAKLLLTPKDV